MGGEGQVSLHEIAMKISQKARWDTLTGSAVGKRLSGGDTSHTVPRALGPGDVAAGPCLAANTACHNEKRGK